MAKLTVLLAVVAAFFVTASCSRPFYSVAFRNDTKTDLELMVAFDGYKSMSWRVSPGARIVEAGITAPVPKIATVSWTSAGGSAVVRKVPVPAPPREFRHHSDVLLFVIEPKGVIVGYELMRRRY